MQFADSLEAIDDAENVELTVTVTGGSVSGTAVQICERPSLSNCEEKEPKASDASSATFDLGKGEDLDGRTVMVDTVIADVGVGEGPARIMWTFENARKAFTQDEGYEEGQDFPDGDTASHADFEF